MIVALPGLFSYFFLSRSRCGYEGVKKNNSVFFIYLRYMDYILLSQIMAATIVFFRRRIGQSLHSVGSSPRQNYSVFFKLRKQKVYQ